MASHSHHDDHLGHAMADELRSAEGEAQSHSHDHTHDDESFDMPASAPARRKLLQSLFPDHGNMRDKKHQWLLNFKAEQDAIHGEGSPDNLFSRLFEGDLGHVHYTTPLDDEAVQAVLTYYAEHIEAAIQGDVPFEDGVLASMLGELSPHLKILGHHYDDLLRVFEYAMTGNAKVMFQSLDNAGADAHHYDDVTGGLHIHSGKPLPEVGVVLAMGLGVAAVSNQLGENIPWSAQVALKAAGTWPLFQSLVRGELEHALAHVKDGENLQDAVKQLLVMGLLGAGIFGKGEQAFHAWNAGAFMEAILATVGYVQTNATERSVAALEATLESLPSSVEEVHDDHTHSRNVHHVTTGETIIELKKGDMVPMDVTIASISDGKSSVLADPYRSRGQMAQHYAMGDQLDQGSVILDDVTVQARVAHRFEESSITKAVEMQRHYQPSQRQSIARSVGDKWVWGTIAGSMLVAAANIIRPIAKGVGIDLNNVLERTTSFATLSSPCNILVATMIEGATSRSLLKEGVVPVRGDALTKAADISTYAMDFTGTLSMGAELDSTDFYDSRGNELEQADDVFALATVAGMKAGSQHLKQKAMRRVLMQDMTADKANALSDTIGEAVEDLGQGVRAIAEDGRAIRVGKLDYVADGQPIPDAIKSALKNGASDRSHTFIRVGEQWGVMAFKDRLRDGAKEMVQSLGAENVHILTGDNDRDYILNYTRQLGLSDEQVITDASPDAKARYIEGLKARGETVAMIGDGMNDAAPMRAANVSFAMQDTHHEGVLGAVDFLVPNLASVVPMKGMSQKVNMISSLTLGFSMIYTGVTAAMDALGVTKLPVIGAAFAHEGMSAVIASVHQVFSKRLVQGFEHKRDALLLSSSQQAEPEQLTQPDNALRDASHSDETELPARSTP